MVKSGADRARRDAEGIGDLRRFESDEVAQHEDRALLRGEPTKAPIQLVPIDHADVVVRTAGESLGRMRMVATRRRARCASAMQDRTRRRRSHASKRSGSRRPGRSRQAITSASCTASSVRSTSRRIRCAIAKSRSPRTRIRSAYASRSPSRAASTRSRSTCIVPCRRSAGRRSDPYWGPPRRSRSIFAARIRGGGHAGAATGRPIPCQAPLPSPTQLAGILTFVEPSWPCRRGAGSRSVLDVALRDWADHLHRVPKGDVRQAVWVDIASPRRGR